jgi:hypothetical protein
LDAESGGKPPHSTSLSFFGSREPGGWYRLWPDAAIVEACMQAYSRNRFAQRVDARLADGLERPTPARQFGSIPLSCGTMD